MLHICMNDSFVVYMRALAEMLQNKAAQTGWRLCKLRSFLYEMVFVHTEACNADNANGQC